MPKVSVIMGVYNCKNFKLLEQSVESIINQSFTDFEFIICNDGSTNNTLDILKKIENKDRRIKIISYEQNRGLSYALNECLKIASGKYIARQDDDDISYKNRLEREYIFLENNNEYDIVGTLADVFDDNGIWGEYKNPERPKKRDFYWNSPFIHPTVMIKKEAFDLVSGYRYCKETRRCEDLDLFMRMYAKGFIGYNIQEKLYLYKMVNDPYVKYRPMKFRIDEAIVKFRGYREMGVFFGGIPYILKPILIGLIPQKILYLIKKTRY